MADFLDRYATPIETAIAAVIRDAAKAGEPAPTAATVIDRTVSRLVPTDEAYQDDLFLDGVRWCVKLAVSHVFAEAAKDAHE